MSTSHAPKHSTNSITIIGPDNATTADSAFTSSNMLKKWFVNSTAATSAERQGVITANRPGLAAAAVMLHTDGSLGRLWADLPQWWAI
jgi:hypothetical protein